MVCVISYYTMGRPYYQVALLTMVITMKYLTNIVDCTLYVLAHAYVLQN